MNILLQWNIEESIFFLTERVFKYSS